MPSHGSCSSQSASAPCLRLRSDGQERQVFPKIALELRRVRPAGDDCSRELFRDCAPSFAVAPSPTYHHAPTGYASKKDEFYEGFFNRRLAHVSCRAMLRKFAPACGRILVPGVDDPRAFTTNGKWDAETRTTWASWTAASQAVRLCQFRTRPRMAYAVFSVAPSCGQRKSTPLAPYLEIVDRAICSPSGGAEEAAPRAVHRVYSECGIRSTSVPFSTRQDGCLIGGERVARLDGAQRLL